MIYRFKYHFPCMIYRISLYNRPYKRWLIGDEHFVWLRTRNVFAGSIITTCLCPVIDSLQRSIVSMNVWSPILIICFKYKCMHWHRASRKRLPRNQEQCLAPRNLYAAAQYARNRYDSPGCITVYTGVRVVALAALSSLAVLGVVTLTPPCKDMTYLDFLCSRILLLELWLIHDISTHYNIMIICNYTNK